ncbi:hypothetical protein XA68_13479 [Ophiocordyceps unilateralis]|uniref:NAD(P)H-hydrate epimerase n=1 Tax=Ophiocordyceps unilateralis TaxID=268505 RepID=A0A2A9PCC4_OPHUN|nr:hypothetical protein XA68_13479 [Ophiocordyceps unilateralis]
MATGIRTLGAKAAASLDQDLMTACGYSIDQLMELAGLSVSQAVYRLHPPTKGRRVLVVCGPGNNGGDGLVAARHLFFYGYQPAVFYPKRSKGDLFPRLAKQLEVLQVPFVDDFESAMASTDQVVDAIFGFSFSGEVREPFPGVIRALEQSKLPITSVDAPSSWDIEKGPPTSGLGSSFMPTALVSLTAPKPLVKHFQGRHFIGGRFVPPSIASKYEFDLPKYEGIDQVIEVSTAGGKI